MSLAPGPAEQAALYIELFGFSTLGLMLMLVAVVFNWRVGRGLGKAVAEFVPIQLGGAGLRAAAERALARWQDQFRRVRRFITLLFAVSLLAIAFADATIITVAGTQLRADGVASQWQRWAAYTFAMTLTSAGMAQYYAIETVATWILVLVPAAAGMGMGVFASLTSVGTNGGAAKVVVFSVWGPVLLMALVPLFLIYTTYDILARSRWWRGFPILVHVAFPLALWIVLWTGPEVGGPNNVASRVVAAWVYLVLVLLWFLVDLAMVYFWSMGPPKQRTSATDAVLLEADETGGGAKRGTRGRGRGSRSKQQLVNLDPRSPHYMPPGGGGFGPYEADNDQDEQALLYETVRGALPKPRTMTSGGDKGVARR